jgi:hypothetical protein
MATVDNGGEERPRPRLFGYSFALLLFGVVGILVGVVVVESVPATLGGALIAVGFGLVYVGFLTGLYLDLRGPRTAQVSRPLDGESG